MPFDLGRRLQAAATAIVATTAAIAGSLTIAPSAAAQGCPDIEVIFARGTDEPTGIGRVGAAFVNALKGKVGGRSVGSYAVVYPANKNFLAASEGANDMSGRISYMAGACPNTKLVLGGYSQGAAVVDVVAAVPVPALSFGNPLSPELADRIAAVAVFGNPSNKLMVPLTVSPLVGAKTIDLCNGGDPICNANGEDMAAHKVYEKTGMPNQAADFVAGRL